MFQRRKSAALAAALFLALALPARAAEAGYEDVPEDAWYAQAAAYCRENGLMDGTSAGRFSPGGVMTRAMLAAVLYRAAGEPEVSGSSGFADAAEDAWYARPVRWASAGGILRGYGDGRFGPGDPVSREQLAAALWRLAGSPQAADAGFADGDAAASWAREAVNWAGSSGIMSGVGGGRFDPKSTATRAQAAMVLMNYHRAFGGGVLSVRSAMDVMCEPSGILALEDGSLLVTDTYNKLIWRVVEGASTVYAGSLTVADPYGRPLGGYNDAAPEESFFREPWAITPFLDGWAVSDTANDAVRLITPHMTQTVNGHTEEDLRLTDLGVAFDHPTGLATDEEGSLYISDTYSGAIRKVTEDGAVTTVADGLEDPMGLCWYGGALYAAETGANRIIRIDPSGAVTLVAGSGQEGLADGRADQAAFSAPQALTVGEDGTVYVSDTGNGAVRRIQGGQVDTLAVRDRSRMDGYPVSPRGLLLQDGVLYVCDNFARKVLMITLK